MDPPFHWVPPIPALLFHTRRDSATQPSSDSSRSSATTPGHLTCILLQAGSEDDHFKAASNGVHEVVEPGPFEHVHVHYLILDLHWDDIVRVGDGLEGAVHQRLVQIQHERLLASILLLCNKNFSAKHSMIRKFVHPL